MYTLSTLLERLQSVSQARLISSGYGLWLVWSGSFNNAVGHTLRDHGLVQLVDDPCQSFWVSFNPEVFRALAKLQIWAKLNPLPLFCQVFPVTALVGYDMSLSVSVPRELTRQQAGVSEDLEVLLHPKVSEGMKAINGLSFGPVVTMQGLAGVGWAPLVADQGMDYTSPANWYGVIRPLGRLGEREAIAGWRAFFAEVQGVFQRLNIRYLADDAKGFVIFPLESYRQLRLYCTEISTLLADLKATQRAYWPCVFAITEQRGMSFSMDLPHRMGLDWDRLSSDFLHMRYRDGYALYDTFKVNEVSYGGDQESLDSWCNVSIRQAEGQGGQGTIEMPMPRRLLAGALKECYYCGLKNHAALQCPSKSQPPFRSQVWVDLGRKNLEDMAQAFKNLDEKADPTRFLSQAVSLFGGEGVDAALFRAMFAIGVPYQLGMLPVVQRIKSREWPVEPEQLSPEEPWPLAEAFVSLQVGDLEKAKECVRAVSAKAGRSFEAACLEGFIALEADDHHMAQFYWQEAGRIGQTNIQQCYVFFLQARLREVAADYREALGLYRQVLAGSSKWLEPTYREGVCMVKMGFTGQSLEIFADLVNRDPLFFNRILVDTEIDRGRVHVLSGLWGPWRDAQARAKVVGVKVAALLKELPQWFEEDHAFRKPALAHLERMDALANTDNYVAFREVGKGMDGFALEMQKQIDEEIKRIKERVKLYAQRLREVQYEAGWFPFPKLLRDFNRDFNFCVKRINWVMTQPLRTADNFRTARRHVPEIEEHLIALSKRLVSLRIVRDSTLFAMILGKNFVWIEVVGLALALLTIPVLLFYSSKMASNWVVEGILAQKWDFQKGLIFLVTLFSLGLASLMSVLSFERKKRQLFEADADRRAEQKKPSAKPSKQGGKAAAAKPGAKPAAKPPAKPAAKPAAKGPGKK
ncbi:MAG: tetratricopeptide repeat protein [Humidesulfovibrio sp.]|uniref:tetratricopeptide repeat protein n=1 Tax=Humidesulfovibrio sp. TaxID=2910988 RepID=UPI002734F048|nr:tetratricopeptide repeat protein [Humidesulfovibrio sp.]MDP2848755.1 tetratricopeptide repeat protein [Humidesulfovibrio sp.]